MQPPIMQAMWYNSLLVHVCVCVCVVCVCVCVCVCVRVYMCAHAYIHKSHTVDFTVNNTIHTSYCPVHMYSKYLYSSSRFYHLYTRKV